MAIVRLRGPLKTLAGGCAEHPLEGGTIAELLRELERTRPRMSGWILDERGRLRRHLHVFRNGQSASEESPVAADDRIDVLQAISGGDRS